MSHTLQVLGQLVWAVNDFSQDSGGNCWHSKGLKSKQSEFCRSNLAGDSSDGKIRQLAKQKPFRIRLSE